MAMRIAICDDEENQLALITAYTAEFIKRENLDINIKKFVCPQALLNYEKQYGSSAVYLLDIVMDGMTGLQLGQHIREYNKRGMILYLTTAREYPLQAFTVHAFSYLLKPLDKALLFTELEKCFAYCLPPQRQAPVITVKTAAGLQPLRLENINAVEYFDHRLVYHTTDNQKIETISSRERFDKQAAEVAQLDIFIKCASSYFVNMENIIAVTPRGFKMKNGAEFPITRKYAATKDVFLKFKFKESETN